MWNYFGKEPTNTLYIGEDFGALSISKETFAGYKWDAICTYFHNDKLCEIRFRYHDNFKYTEQNVINRFNSLQKELSTKYGRILKVNKSDKNATKVIYYFDGKYMVCLGIRGKIQNNKKIYYETDLEYYDMQLMEQPIINNDL
ncbi:MAG: hypothetical protein IJE73_06765 [Muribaculaceae bacterium]|nr:hypothetical protein [Muribaculaceae bacterium]